MKAFAIITLFCATSCSGTTEQYAQADYETYRAIAPEYLGYVQTDETLSSIQKDRRVRTLQSWLIRIRGILPESTSAIRSNPVNTEGRQ